MIKHNVKQGGDDWLKLRAGMPTCSELDNLITPLLKVREGEMVNTYLCTKVAERWLGSPLQTFSGGPMEQGTIREEEAIPFYEFTFNCEIERIGFVTTDDGTFGCSPDGMFADGSGIEIKCPMPHTQAKWLLAGTLPKEHAVQVHGSMAVTGANFWRFMSYCRGMPPLVLKIMRDDDICKAILAVVENFNSALNAAYAKIVKINRGEPQRG